MSKSSTSVLGLNVLCNGPVCTWETSSPLLSKRTPQRNFIVSLADSWTAPPETSPKTTSPNQVLFPACSGSRLGQVKDHFTPIWASDVWLSGRLAAVCRKRGTSRTRRSLNGLAIRTSVSRASSQCRLYAAERAAGSCRYGESFSGAVDVPLHLLIITRVAASSVWIRRT
jgi:hypothetical protein